MALVSRLLLSCGLGHHPAQLSPTEDKKPYFRKLDDVITDSNENEVPSSNNANTIKEENGFFRRSFKKKLIISPSSKNDNTIKEENGFFRKSFKKKLVISPLATAIPNGKSKPSKKTDNETKDKDKHTDKTKDGKPAYNRSVSVLTNTDAKSQTSQRSRSWTITKQFKRIRRRKKDLDHTDGQSPGEDELAKAERKVRHTST